VDDAFRIQRREFDNDKFDGTHVVYLARGVTSAATLRGSDTELSEVLEKRGFSGRYKNSH
jgi:hypothetical protein